MRRALEERLLISLGLSWDLPFIFEKAQQTRLMRGMRYAFADCVLDTERHEFRRDGALCHLEPQVFRLLELLLERAGEVVTRDEIIDIVWNGRIVSEATIAARISAARAAVGDTGQAQEVIRTVTRVGLQCVAEVSHEAPAGPVAAPAPDPLAMRMTASADGSLIAWAEEGAGPPLIRAGHWLTNLDRDRTSPIWGPWLARLGRGRRLIRYDNRGTGLSDVDCGAPSLERYAEDLLAVADAAGLETFDIFAASQSLAVSCVVAARHPDRVRRIVSYGGYPQGSAVRADAGSAAMAEAMGTMLRLGWGQPDGGYMKSFLALFMPSSTPEQAAAFARLQLASATPDRAVEIRDVIARFDVVALLPEVKAPVLVAHARGDSLHPFAQAQLLMQHLPDARLLPLESDNHILMPDEPAFEMLMEAVDGFLA